MAVYPKTLLPIAATVGGLALFLIFASLILVSQPFGTTVRGYFDSVDRANEVGSLTFGNGTSIVGFLVNDTRMSFPSSSGNGSLVKDDTRISFPTSSGDGSLVKDGTRISFPSSSGNGSLVKDGTRISFPSSSGNGSLVKDDGLPRSVSHNRTSRIADSGCDLYDGKWVYDSAGPLYSNDSCPVLTQMQNCQGNGRPDKDYENWRWKPTHCDLPRFDPRKFLELMRGKTLAYVGDSVARNHMESMLCILWQAEVPRNRGNKKMQRFYFRSTSTTIIRIWSSWLVRKTTEAFDFAPAGVDKLHLDAPDENFMVYVPKFDVLVLSSGHWFMKRSVYIVNDTIAGGQLWWPDKSRRKTVNNVEAFEISVETIVSALVTHPNYTGLTVVRSYSPDHYEGGSWNTGGSCTGKVRPAAAGEVVESGFTNTMHDRQVSGVRRAARKRRNGSRVRVMDVTRPFSYRHDGHPGPYRNQDPNKVVKRAADGRPPPQDCLHWCMPGPIDTWNEMLFEVIRRDFEGVDT